MMAATSEFARTVSETRALIARATRIAIMIDAGPHDRGVISLDPIAFALAITHKQGHEPLASELHPDGCLMIGGRDAVATAMQEAA